MQNEQVYLAAGGTGLQIADLQDRHNPEILSTYDTPGTAMDVQVAGDSAYLADGTGGVQVLAVSDPSNPSLEASYEGINALGIHVEGDMLYVVDGSGGLTMLRYASSSTGTFAAAGGEFASPGGAIAYQFPPGAFTSSVSLTHTTRSIVNLPPAGELKDIEHSFDLRAVDAATGLGVQPSQPYSVTVNYADHERGPVVEDSIGLYYWDGAQWVREPTSVSFPDENFIQASPDHFSFWAALGAPDRLFAPYVSTSRAGVSYRVYLAGVGWTDWVPGVDTAGMVGEDQQLEALQIRLLDPPEGLGMSYQVHLQNIGWMDWVEEGEIAGLPGGDLRLEAVRIAISGAPPGYQIAYQAHVEDLGWMAGVFDGEIAGTTGQALAMQAIRIELIKPVPMGFSE